MVIKLVFTPRTITIKITIIASTPSVDIVLFIISVCLSVT